MGFVAGIARVKGDSDFTVKVLRKYLRISDATLKDKADVVIPRERKGHSSRALIDACIPYERRGDYPPVAESSGELKAKVREKWKTLLLKQ
jgi:hypothetical protein